jgi:hypothetical protein
VSDGYTSLSEALEASAASGAPLLTVRFSVHRGWVTTIEFRKSFTVLGGDQDDENHTTELTAMVALLRQYGKRQGSGRLPYDIRIVPTHDAEHVFVSERLVAFLESKAARPETVPTPLAKHLRGDDDSVAEDERRRALEGLNVVEVRKCASALKVAGAWRERKAALIDRILAAERVGAAAS